MTTIPDSNGHPADGLRSGADSSQAAASLNRLLFVVCGLTDFSAFVVMFTVSRSLAEAGATPLFLGCVGAGMSFSAGIASILSGLFSQKFSSRVVFLAGALCMLCSIVGCSLMSLSHGWFLVAYWGLGFGLGLIYPPLIGWLNQGEDAHANRHGVSRTLILYCIAWNAGMMCGQLTAGELFARGIGWSYFASIVVSAANMLLATVVALRVTPPIRSQDPAEFERPAHVELASAFKRLSWLANLGGMFGGSLVVHLLPDLAVMIGVPAANHGMILAAWRAVIIMTYLLMHRFHFWHYRFSTSILSQGLAAAGLVVIAGANSGGTLMLGLALLGQLVGYNYFSGLFYSTAGSSDESRALAAGIHEATLAAGMAAGTIVGGMLGSWVSPRMPYLMAAAAMVLLVGAQSVAWWSWVRPLVGPSFAFNDPDEPNDLVERTPRPAAHEAVTDQPLHGPFDAQ